MILHSYSPEYDWVRDINSALEPMLSGSQIPYQVFYMDTKRKSDAAWKKEAARQAHQLIKDYAPRVVIAIDDNAQEFVVRRYTGKSPIQFVFAGVNADPAQYGYPAENVTGILERAYPSQVFSMLKMIVPTSLDMVWISDDSATADLVMPRVRHKAENGKLPISIQAFEQVATFDQWRTAIAKYDADDSIGAMLIPLYHTVKVRAGGRSMEPAKVMQWTVANTRKPIVGLWPFSTDDGAICAVVVDPREHGKTAALMTKQILAGKQASELPMLVNKDGFVIVNIVAATKLGIEVPFEVILSADEIIESD